MDFQVRFKTQLCYIWSVCCFMDMVKVVKRHDAYKQYHNLHSAFNTDILWKISTSECGHSQSFRMKG